MSEKSYEGYSYDELMRHEPKYCTKEEYKKAVSDYVDRQEDKWIRDKDYEGDSGQNPYK